MNTNELYHHGILGQKWGVRRYQNKDRSLTPAGQKRISSKTQRQAAKDAKEYARAKMYYGEGAGTRRKLIKNTVNERSKDPDYDKAFKEALANQNMAEHVAKAKTERKAKDTVNSVKKTGRGIVNIASGHPERVGATMAALAAGAGGAHKTGADKKLVQTGKNFIDQVKHCKIKMS